MNERTAIYRCFDGDDELLYVGISKDPGARWEQHKVHSPWSKQVAMRTVEWLDTRQAAMQAERKAIYAEGPRYNQVHNRRPATLAASVAAPGRSTGNTLADVVGDLSDEQLRKIAALFKLGQLPPVADAKGER